MTIQTNASSTANGYRTGIVINASPQKIIEGLTSQIPDWWTENFEGSSQQINDKFTVRFGNTFKTILVKEIIPLQKIVWQITDAYADLPEIKNKREWIGTEIVWEILPEGNMTKLILTHIDLTPEFECYDVCDKGWQFYFGESLYKFLTSNKGLPFKNN